MFQMSRCLDSSENHLPCDEHFVHGIKIVIEALCMPMYQILHNAGLEAESQIIIQNIKDSENKSMGFDVRNNKITDMKATGILDLRISDSVFHWLMMSVLSLIRGY